MLLSLTVSANENTLIQRVSSAKILEVTFRAIANTLLVVGFLRMALLWFPPTGKVDRLGYDKHS